MSLRKSGFTLVELLVVMAIIGLLAGLMFPALGAVKKKAWTTKTRELVVQVQTAWQIHFNDFRSFPERSLIDDSSVDGSGDMQFPMGPQQCCMLNWRCAKPSKFPGTAADWSDALSKQFSSAIKEGRRPKGLKITKSGKSFDVATRDAYMERDELQWCVGIVNSWGIRDLARMMKTEGFSAARSAAKGSESGHPDYRVWVKLDTGYDGALTEPTDAPILGVPEIKKSVIAWTLGETKKDKAIGSW